MKDKTLKSKTPKEATSKKGKDTVQDLKNSSKIKKSPISSNKEILGSAPKSKTSPKKPKTTVKKIKADSSPISKPSSKIVTKKAKTVRKPKVDSTSNKKTTVENESEANKIQPVEKDKKDTLELLEHRSIKLPYDKEIISVNIKNAIENGSYEGKEAREIDRIVEPKERILEIGAGLGFISSIASKNENVESVMAVEANPNLIPYIKNVHTINNAKNIEVINGILSNSIKNRMTNFYVRNDFWASSLSPIPKNFIKTVSVPVYSLSEIIESFKPTLVVCDIEGGELDLFKNANLEGVEKVFVEIHQKVLGRLNIKKLFDSFSSRDFHYDQHHSSGSVILFSHIYRGQMSKKRQFSKL